MKKRTLTMISVSLIAVGMLSLLSSVAGMLFGFRGWQLWPLIVVAAGLAFVLPPFLTRKKKRGLGGLFIPGMPVLATGLILLVDSVFGRWNVWSWLWPLEVTSVALGFLFAALYMDVIWLLIPTIIIGANGLLFHFCAITGWWSVWSVLWVIEPLSVGIALLVVNGQRKSTRLQTAGLVLCVLAGLGFAESLVLSVLSMLFPVWRLWRLMGPSLLIMAGLALLFSGVLNKTSDTPSVAEA
ncbi:MAG: hypothetical protein JXA33_10785 [Anaerolineae bacterium]|nr:hypothetical protein [Anaerolineae bacterium]